MDTKKLIGLLFLSIILWGCGYKPCPSLNATELILPMKLLDRKDTLHVGDTLFFKSLFPLLPMNFGNTYFDEKLVLHFKYLFSGPQGYANDSFSPFITQNVDDELSNNANPNYINKKRTLSNNESFEIGFIVQDTGLFAIYPKLDYAEFIETSVPDYKGSCERYTENVHFDWKNLQNQPLAEQTGSPYTQILCTGASCDTLVVCYVFRVEP